MAHLVDVLVDRQSGVQLLIDTVQARAKDHREREVRVTGRALETLDERNVDAAHGHAVIAVLIVVTAHD